jgi:PAS domain S-box-containing protein
VFRVYWCLRHEHEPSLVALAILLCVVSTFTASTFLCRYVPSGGTSQRRWLLGAGLVTGLGVWATHFAAMLAYTPGLNIGIDGRVACTALASAIVFSMAGWIVAAGARPWHPLLGGMLVGVGLAVAHYLDMLSLTVGGYLVYDHDLIAISITAGIFLCALSGWLIFYRRGRHTPLLATAALTLGICTLHFFGMAAITILPDPSVVVAPSWLVANKLGGFVILAVIMILAAALWAALYDRRVAARSIADGQVLKSTVTALQSSEERYRLVMKATTDTVWDWHRDTDLTTWGDAIGTRFGYPEAQAGTTAAWWHERVHPDDRPGIRAGLQRALEGSGDLWSANFRFRKSDGRYADVATRGYILRDDNGEAVRAVGSMIDVSERKAMEDSLRWAANHDPLTGLANRALFGTSLSLALDRAMKSGLSVGLVLLDIDHFKVVNDTHGHIAGDELLIEISRRLAATIPGVLPWRGSAATSSR